MHDSWISSTGRRGWTRQGKLTVLCSHVVIGTMRCFDLPGGRVRAVGLDHDDEATQWLTPSITIKPTHKRSSMNGVFGGSLLDQATPFNVRTTWNRVHQYALHLAKDPTYEKTDFLQLGRRVRAHRIAYVILHDKPSLITLLSLATSDHDEPASAVHDALLIELENIETILAKHLYGWIMPRYPSVAALQKEFSTATGNKDLELGIVLTTGQWHFELAAHAIITLRDVLKCDLPIEIQYAGPNDLTPDMHKAFNAMPGVRTVDVLDRFDSSVGVAGWAIKPFAILASRFRTVIFMDADALLFQNPENLVRTSTLFKQYGTLFYHDRTVKNGGNLNWFKGINPTYTRYASSLRYMDDRSHNEMESGVVVVDKGRTGNLVGMLMTCVLNSRVERDGMTYKHMHGDKESFWMSWDIARVPFKFTPAFGGAVGYKNEKGNVCGGLFHTDEYLKPLWWNGGVIKNKHHDRDGNLMEFEYAAFDTVGKDIEWEWETPKSPFCLGPKHREFEIVELTAKEKSDGAEFVRIFKEMKAAGWKEYFTQKYNVKW
ncbi:mannosyltransferase putative-domain-containing protein [Chytriomyces sp. MP71]|nr:mannosyltransferase putative-domain-containing protein [Chytriomyces sp. MP71]